MQTYFAHLKLSEPKICHESPIWFISRANIGLVLAKKTQE